MFKSARSQSHCSAAIFVFLLGINTAEAQHQALVQGERVISVGPAIQTQSHQSQSVLQVNPPGNSLPPPQKATTPKLAPQDCAAELRLARSEFQHDLNQAAQRIDHLSQSLKLAEEQLAAKPNLSGDVAKLQTEVDSITKKLAQSIAKHAQVRQSLETEHQLAMAKWAKQEQALRAEIAAQFKLMQEMSKQVEKAKQQETAAKEKAQEVKSLREKLEQASACNEKQADAQERLEHQLAELKKKYDEAIKRRKHKKNRI